MIKPYGWHEVCMASSSPKPAINNNDEQNKDKVFGGARKIEPKTASKSVIPLDFCIWIQKWLNNS